MFPHRNNIEVTISDDPYYMLLILINLNLENSIFLGTRKNFKSQSFNLGPQFKKKKKNKCSDDRAISSNTFYVILLEWVKMYILVIKRKGMKAIHLSESPYCSGSSHLLPLPICSCTVWKNLSSLFAAAGNNF